MLRFPLHGVASVETLYIPFSDCLQHCKLILPRSIGCGGVGTRRPTNVATVAVARL